MEMAREDEKTKRTRHALVASDEAILWKMGAENCGRGERENHRRNRRRDNKGGHQQQ